MSEENDPAAGGMSPDQLLAEFEARLREVEAAGGEAPSELKRQLERVKRMMAAGQAEGIQFMQAGDQKSGLMGFLFLWNRETVGTTQKKPPPNKRMQLAGASVQRNVGLCAVEESPQLMCGPLDGSGTGEEARFG